jgi:hypothetical protein
MKKKKQIAAHKKKDRPQEQMLSLMAIQEKLGLFKTRPKPQAAAKRHDFLKKKPLGLI